MGKAARLAAVSTPKSSAVKFEELEYLKLRLLIRDVEVIVAAAQADVNKATATRDAYLKTLAEKYAFSPSITQMQWNDETCEFRFS